MPGEVVHSDVSGRFNSLARGGTEYYVTFIDEVTWYTVVYLIKRKSEVIGAFKAYLAALLHTTCCCSLVTDQGGEYLSKDFHRLL